VEKLGRVFLYLFLISSVVIFFGATLAEQNNSMVSPIARSLGNVFRRGPSLEEVINKSLEGAQGTYSIDVENLKTSELYYKDEHKSYESASLYKLWVMAETYRQIEAGTLKEDQVIGDEIADLNATFKIDPENAELTEGGISFPIKQALTQMITISHNYAALLLTKEVKISNLQKFLANNGFRESNVGETPATTASDMALFYEKLYKGKLGSPESTQKMIELLKKQQLNDKLPKNLPKGVVVAHKTGELGYFSHDAGIVFTPKGDYIIVVMSESNSPAGAEERIAQISKVVYEYFTQ
jgi:beta-lactamase class A